MHELYELVVFTAGTREYAEPIIKKIDEEDKFFSMKLFRDCTTFINGNHVKDLSKLGKDLSRVIIIDNLQHSFALHPKNGIVIKPFINDVRDRALLHLTPFLRSIVRRDVADVRDVLHTYVPRESWAPQATSPAPCPNPRTLRPGSKNKVWVNNKAGSAQSVGWARSAVQMVALQGSSTSAAQTASPSTPLLTSLSAATHGEPHAPSSSVSATASLAIAQPLAPRVQRANSRGRRASNRIVRLAKENKAVSLCRWSDGCCTAPADACAPMDWDKTVTNCAPGESASDTLHLAALPRGRFQNDVCSA
mmetsp:Transcript_21192/g.36392  ORF Transcript_21192/g.36392 Transcript_21192/m.36392 type:complete len:306 (-) Transcript_21192:367-1284(-)